MLLSQICNQSPTSIQAGDMMIVLAVSRFDICGWMIIKAAAFLGVTIIYSVQVPALLSFDRQ